MAPICGQPIVFTRRDTQTQGRLISTAHCAGLFQNGLKDGCGVIAALADNRQDFRGRGFSREPLLHLAELAGVFDCNDRLIGKGLDQRDFIVGVGFDEVARMKKTADPDAVVDQRYKQIGAHPGIFDHGDKARIAPLVLFGVGHVVDMDDLLANDRFGRDRLCRIHREPLFVEHRGDVIRHVLAGSHALVRIPFAPQHQGRKRRTQQTVTKFYDLVKNGRFVVTAAADDRQDFRGRGLPLEPLPDFPELLNILDGDDCLGGKGFHQCNFVGLKRSLLFAIQPDNADRSAIVGQQRDRQHGPNTFIIDNLATVVLALDIGVCQPQIRRMDHPRLAHGLRDLHGTVDRPNVFAKVIGWQVHPDMGGVFQMGTVG